MLKNIFVTMWQDFVKFITKNPQYFICSIIYFVIASLLLGGLFTSFLIAFLSYVISLVITFTPLGEKILRFFEHVRKIETKREKEYLLPLFEEVYQDALEQTPSICKSIKLYISEDKIINGYAMGKRTIVLTRGAIEAFHREEIKGILAHELGHMINGDTKALLMSIIGNSIFSIIVLGCKIAMAVFNFFISAVTGEKVIFRIVHFIIRLCFDYSVIAFLFVGNAILSLNSRYSEFLADDYAFQIGYGEELKKSFYLLNKLDMGGQRSIRDGLMASHPHTGARIQRLERKLQVEVIH